MLNICSISVTTAAIFLALCNANTRQTFYSSQDVWFASSVPGHFKRCLKVTRSLTKMAKTIGKTEKMSRIYAFFFSGLNRNVKWSDHSGTFLRGRSGGGICLYSNQKAKQLKEVRDVKQFVFLLLLDSDFIQRITRC